MANRLRYRILLSLVLTSALILGLAYACCAGTTTYLYDELDRLKWAQYGDGTTIRYDYDEIGNLTAKTIISDNTSPITTASPTGGYFVSGALTVTLTCSDGTGAGCNKIFYTTDGMAPTTTSPIYTAPLSITPTTTLKYFAIDFAGVSEAVKTQSYLLDTTAPTTTASPPGGYYNASQTVSLTCSDGSGVGCNKVYYSTNGTNPTTASSVYSAPITITPPKTLKYFSIDNNGNSEAVKTQTYTLDTVIPTGSIIINATAAITTTVAVTLTLTCSDNIGCSQMKFSNDNVTWSTVETYATGKPWNLASGDGTKTVYVKVKDSAGNWSPTYSDTISLNTAALSGGIIRIVRTGAKYTTLQTAYAAAIEGDVIQILAVQLNEVFDVARNITVKLDGGYASGFSSKIDATIIKGDSHLRAGKVNMSNVSVKQ